MSVVRVSQSASYLEIFLCWNRIHFDRFCFWQNSIHWLEIIYEEKRVSAHRLGTRISSNGANSLHLIMGSNAKVDWKNCTSLSFMLLSKCPSSCINQQTHSTNLYLSLFQSRSKFISDWQCSKLINWPLSRTIEGGSGRPPRDRVPKISQKHNIPNE